VPYAIIAEWLAQAGEEDAVAAAVEKLIEPSRAEPGNILYQPNRDPENPLRFVIYELYADEAAFQAHVDSPHFAEHGLGDAVPRLSSRTRTAYEPVMPYGS
jgi:quinol monooxygenase YgiN